MIIAVASGKGGTGKTTVATNLARTLGERAQLIDCDVEEPNAHIFLRPTIYGSEEVTLPVPEVDISKCTLCGECGKFCQYNAIVAVGKQVLAFHELCHGCGGCTRVCPEGAIHEVTRTLGVLERGTSDRLEFVHGRLRVGEAMSPPLIKAARRKANQERTVILDAPPGTSCPVIASIKGADFCLLVTEPTPFGLNDLKLAVEVVRSLGIPQGIVLNRCDLGNGELKEYCHQESLRVLLEIPEDRGIAEAYSRGEMIVDIYPHYEKTFMDMYAQIVREIEAVDMNRVKDPVS
jgi:MinD superfamily P-loop ATPase